MAVRASISSVPDAGADLVLRKPIDPFELQKTIARLATAV
jgi:CheY-like chemotaxis protein